MKNVIRQTPAAILLVDRDVLVRTSVAAYLRECGFRVVEASTIDEAYTVLQDRTVALDILVVDPLTPGSQSGFWLVQWSNRQRPELKTILVGTPERVAAAATELCEDGPTPPAINNPKLLHDQIRRLLAEGPG